MKKMVFLLTAATFLVSGSLAIAIDMNWHATDRQWRQQQEEQKMKDAQLKAIGSSSNDQSANTQRTGYRFG